MLLRPTPELWTLSLPHRTQILYAPDMSFITMKLGLTPGAKVVEAGTGSGSFTHFLARTVGRVDPGVVAEGSTAGRGWKGQDGMGISLPKGKGVQTRPPRDKSTESSSPPVGAGTSTAASSTADYDSEADSYNGKVWTFEFHKERAMRAREEFIAHQLIPLVSTSHRNVCLNGFPSSISSQADAVFLDLPAPWEAIPFVPAVLNPHHTTRICCFSPCIEQVLRTVKALNEHGFKDVEMFESLVRTHESMRANYMEMPLKGIESVQERLKSVLAKKEKISAWQKQKSKEKKDRDSARAATGEEGGDEQNLNGDGEMGKHSDEENKHFDEQSKHLDEQAKHHEEDEEHRGDNAPGDAPTHNLPIDPCIVPIGQDRRQTQYMVRSNVYSRTHPNMRGHTSYLTFATLLPRSAGASSSTKEETPTRANVNGHQGRSDVEKEEQVNTNRESQAESQHQPNELEMRDDQMDE